MDGTHLQLGPLSTILPHQTFESAWSAPSIFKRYEWEKLVRDVGSAFSVRSLRAFECADEDKCVGVGLDADKNCFCYT